MKIYLNHYEQINIYNEGGVIFSTIRGGFERISVDGKKRNTIHSINSRVTELELPVEKVRNAIKLDFNKKDIFTIKDMPKNRYSIRNGKALYIHIKYISVENMGEYLSAEANGERNYLTLYKMSFCNPITIQEIKRERIVCDEYTLCEGETFGSGCGRDKNHAVISTFDTEKSPLRFYKNTPPQKGIVKSYFITNIYNELIVQSDYFTKTEKDPERLEREKIAEIFNSCLHNKNISHHDIERLLTKFNISIKEV